MRRDDWPLGPALQNAREQAGISVRAAARRTNGAISSGRWYQLESGYQKVGGQSLPIGTTAATVAAAARAVDWDIAEALKVAGFDERDYQPPAEDDEPIRRYTDEDLLAEVLRRMRGQSHVAHPTETTRAPGQAGQAEEAGRLRRANEMKDGRGVPLGWTNPKPDSGVVGHPGDDRRHQGGSG